MAASTYTTLSVSLLLACAACWSTACTREPALSDPAEAAAVAALPIHLDAALGEDLHLEGLSVHAGPDRRSWIVTLYSKVVHRRDRRPQVWVHAYPHGSPDYFVVNPIGPFPSADPGRVVTDGFLLEQPGAFNLYAGVVGADGSLGPAVALGWIGVGDPDTKAYHQAYRFLQEENDERAAAMLEQTRRDYPNATLP